MSTPPPDDLLGKTLGQYTILEEIGRGGMATVYRARQMSVNRIVAVKVLPRHFLHDPGFYDRFVREVDVVAHLEHPHILPIYDYGNAEGVPYIVMRYLAGGSMAQMIRRGAQPLEELEKPFMQVAEALDYAHLQGIIHRDLKPGNIMLDENGNAYLSDFGIARVLGSDMTGSAIIGTPAYMSPEQAKGMPIDGRSDIYALGIVLFELITGREPYQAETPMGLLLKHMNEPMPLARDFREGVPPQVEDVIEMATAKEPDQRYSSGGELAKAFSAALRGVAPTKIPQPTREAYPQQPAPPTPTTPPATPYPPQQPVYQTGQQPLYQTGQIPQRQGVSVGALLAIVAIVAVAIVGAVFLIPRLNPAPPVEPTPLSAAVRVPTPFFRAETIREEVYSISMPEAWIQGPRGYVDQSDANRLLHIWQSGDNTAFVTLAMQDKGLDGDSEQFQTAINDYDARYYQPQGNQLRLFDEAAADDGTVRRSYRLEGEAFPYGQMDVFYLARDGYLVVLEVYTADSVGGDRDLIQRMQLILDSLRVSRETSAG
jgi:serine/threonine protein kinase